MIEVCLLDMDCVLVDFVRASLDLHQIPMPVDDLWRDRMGTGYNYYWEFFGIPSTEFFAPMNEEWWANLPWTAEGTYILDMLERRFGRTNVVLVTSPSENRGCHEGKLCWMRKNLHKHYSSPLGHVFGHLKWLMAKPKFLLVDDHDVNCDKFKAEGGRVIQVPRAHNRLWAKRHHVVSHIAQELQEL